MQRGRGNRDDFFGFGDPFADFGSFGSFNQHRSMMSSLFERDPFDDPFFKRPFESMLGSSMLSPSMFGPSMFGSSMFGSSMFGPSMFGPSMFGPNTFHPGGQLLGGAQNSGVIEHEPHRSSQSRGPVIEELSSDNEDNHDKNTESETKRKLRSDKEPYVQDPDDEEEEKERRRELLQQRNDFSRASRAQPQSQSFTFQSSTVTYGGANGAYYTSSKTRRIGSDGVAVEESKEADTTTRKATHRISRGIHDKGHTITRKLNSDGKVDTMQMLHNLNEDELAGFEETWRGKAVKHLPGWDQGFLGHSTDNLGSSSSSQAPRGWALPSTEQSPSSRSRPHSNGRMT